MAGRSDFASQLFSFQLQLPHLLFFFIRCTNEDAFAHIYHLLMTESGHKLDWKQEIETLTVVQFI